MNAIAKTPELVVDDAPLVADLEQQLAVIVTTVTTDAECEAANATRNALGAKMKTITEWFKPLVDGAFRQHKLLTERRATVLKPALEADARLVRAISDYVTARANAVAEANRLAAAKARRDEEERIAREAAALEAAGDREQAAAVVEQHLAAPLMPPPAPAPLKLEGVVTIEAYDFEIVNKDLIPRKHMVPNEKTIRAEVKAFGADTRIPGVRVFRQDIVRRGRA